MPTLTKTQLLDQLAALRTHCDRVETELASAKHEAACLREQLVTAQLKTQRHAAETIVGEYTRRDGTHIVKVRLGNSNVIAHREMH